MLGSIAFMRQTASQARSSRPPAGRTHGASSSIWHASTRHRSRPRQSSASMRCSQSSVRGGKALQPPGKVRQVPPWQKSKGSLIVTAALELSRNQIIHFYSNRKNSTETCKLIDQLRRQYKGYRRIYLSWDAAPWHSSEQLLSRVEFLNGWAAHDRTPRIEILPLPAQAQFLNVIESVFSGMARAVIHNSDYATVANAQAAITRYFEDRNRSFAIAPRRAGRSIWGEERMPAAFAVTNNCKDARYR